MINTEILQAEQSMLLEMALINDAIVQHKEDERYEYGMQDRETIAEYEKEFNSEPHN